MNPVDYLVIGHATKDLRPGGFSVGGTVTYASVTAHRLGMSAGVVTRAAPDFPLETEGGAVQIVRLPTPTTTTFENHYTTGARRQYVRAVSAPIGVRDIPKEWFDAPIVHLGPIARELSPELAERFGGALVGVTPQGWMRRWDSEGQVWPCRWSAAAQVLAHAGVLVLSDEDIAGDVRLAEEYAAMVTVLVLTNARNGATVYCGGGRRSFPARPAYEVDPTGAGDVFAAAFLIALYECRDPFEAAEFANCVASFSVEAQGIRGIPTREQARVCLTSPG